MSDVEERIGTHTDKALEDLLRQAERRPTPSPEQAAVARQAVYGEWRKISGRTRRRRQVWRYAIAASLVVGLLVLANQARIPVGDVVPVASIEKSYGSVYVLGEQAELRQTDDLVNIESGQTILTAADASLGLAWGKGGSLRLDENTRVEFLSETAIYLQSGRVYFDSLSGSSSPAGHAPHFAVMTDQGEVTHLGTQFMTGVEPGRLVVSVREGQVTVDGRFHDYTAVPGKQVVFDGRQRPSIVNISSSGELWDWTTRTAPAFDVDGRTLYEFLQWASRELGCELQFEGRAQAVAKQAVLIGAIDATPAEQLRLRLASAALDWHIDEGVIYVREDQ